MGRNDNNTPTRLTDANGDVWRQTEAFDPKGNAEPVYWCTTAPDDRILSAREVRENGDGF
ncbi:hypothetical protein ABZ312_11520 [Streptomyces sp. NPDC006207]